MSGGRKLIGLGSREPVEEPVHVEEPRRLMPSERAAQLVTGDRQDAYGHPYPNHKRIADFWNTRLADKLSAPLEPHEVAACMRLVKEARLMQTRGHADSLVDLPGYADVEFLIHEWEAREAGGGGQT